MTEQARLWIAHFRKKHKNKSKKSFEKYLNK